MHLNIWLILSPLADKQYASSYIGTFNHPGLAWEAFDRSKTKQSGMRAHLSTAKLVEYLQRKLEPHPVSTDHRN